MVMESAVRKEQEDRELLLELEKLAPDMQQQLVFLVRNVAKSTTNPDSGPMISAAGFDLLAALHGAARPQAVTSDALQCAPLWPSGPCVACARVSVALRRAAQATAAFSVSVRSRCSFGHGV